MLELVYIVFGVIILIKAVVFDLDHTLYDRYETLKLCVPEFRNIFKINKDVTDDFFYKELCWADKNYVHRGWEEIFAHLVKCNIFEEVPEYKTYVEELRSLFKIYAVEYPFAKEALLKLRRMGYKTGLITNGDVPLQSQKLKLLNFNDYFDKIIISGATPYQKPQKEVFHLMANELGVDPTEMMYVGDHPLFDVDGSRNAGCTPVWVKTTGTWIFPEIQKPLLQVETVAEIPSILESESELL